MKRSFHMDARLSVPMAPPEPGDAGQIDPDALGAQERAVFERWTDSAGRVPDRDIDTLLRQNLMLRRVIAELVASAGHPRPAHASDGYVADVPTDVIEQASVHGDFSQLTHDDDPELR